LSKLVIEHTSYKHFKNILLIVGVSTEIRNNIVIL